jgi:uncharacterized protein YggE
LLTILPTRVAAEERPHSITVNGTATLRVPPDRVSFSVGVETQGATVGAAFEANRKKIDSVVAALKTKGVAPKEVQTSNLEIGVPYEDGRRLPGYRVSALVTVTRGETQGVGELLQAAIDAGANQAGGLNFSVADPAQFRARGLDLAFQDAQAKAEVLAKLAKRPLGQVLTIVETGPAVGPGFQNNMAAMAFKAGGDVQAGTEQVPFTISVVFELK